MENKHTRRRQMPQTTLLKEDDTLYRKFKAICAQRGYSVRSVLLELIEKYVEDNKEILNDVAFGTTPADVKKRKKGGNQ